MLCVFAVSVRLTGAAISCEAPAVKNGDAATLTCDFKENVNQVKKNVKVQYHPADKPTLSPDLMVTVADCYWTNSQDFKCSMHDGYRFLGINGALATVQILKASQEHVGKYTCEVVPSDPENIQPCRFELRDEPPYLTDDEFDEAIKTVFGVALAALLLSGFLCLFFVVYCIRKRRTCSLTKKRREGESTLENQHEKSSASGVQNADEMQLETKRGDNQTEIEGATNENTADGEREPLNDCDTKTVETPEETKESYGNGCSIA